MGGTGVTGGTGTGGATGGAGASGTAGTVSSPDAATDTTNLDSTAASPDGADGALADAAADRALAASTCGGISCPQLFALADQCTETGMCRFQSTATGANYCFDSGVKSSVSGMVVGTRFIMSTRFARPDGSTCYTLETSAELAGGEQTVIWRDAGGATIATGVARGEQLTLTCGGASADVTGAQCPGTRLARPEVCAMASCP